MIQVPADLEKQKRTVENRLSRELTIFRESSADLAKDASKTLELLQQMAKLFCRTEKIDSQFESCREQLAEVSRRTMPDSPGPLLPVVTQIVQ